MRVLAIVAHPDDIELQCGGTLIKCVERGDEVYACHLSNGDLGHMVIMPEELGKMRCEEARNAAAVGGYHAIYGGFHDLHVYAGNKESRDKVAKLIREINPDFLITHYPKDYMADHVATSQLVFDASFCASVPHYDCGAPGASKNVPIYYVAPSRGVNFLPTEFVDVTSVMEKKKEAFLCHESQVVWLRDHTHTDPCENMYNIADMWGRQCGVKYAEVFTQCYVDGKIRTRRLLPE